MCRAFLLPAAPGQKSAMAKSLEQHPDLQAPAQEPARLLRLAVADHPRPVPVQHPAGCVIYRFVPPPITATMIGDVVGGRGLDKDWMSLDEMDRDMVRAAIGAEDSKFCQHNGFDIEAIEDAMKRNASGGRIRGGSTISQQTAKNVFLWQGGGYFRKGVEAYFTFLIEHLWGKRRIMEVYLNVAETGIGTYGANAGAQRYFGHDASALSRDGGGADRRGAAAAQEARRDRAQGLHPPLRQHHRRPGRRGPPRRARRLRL